MKETIVFEIGTGAANIAATINGLQTTVQSPVHGQCKDAKLRSIEIIPFTPGRPADASNREEIPFFLQCGDFFQHLHHSYRVAGGSFPTYLPHAVLVPRMQTLDTSFFYDYELSITYLPSSVNFNLFDHPSGNASNIAYLKIVIEADME